MNTLITQTNKNPYDILDASGNLQYKIGTPKPTDIQDVMYKDALDELTQQNDLYILGTIATGALILLAISLL